MTALCLLLALFLAGCAASRLQTPANPAQTPSSEAVDALADSTQGTAEDPPHHQAYRLLHQSFQDLQAGRQRRAHRALDGASIVLTDLLITRSLPPDRLAGLIRVCLELYRDLLPPTAPVDPNSPLALLLSALPEGIISPIENHPHYREFWIRKLAGTADVPVDYTPEVVESIRYFQTDGQDIFRRWLSRSGTYMPMILKIFRDAGLPQDLVYKAMIESGFNPRAYSRAGAAGIWQFARYTAPLYGLKRNTWIDERRDPVKSTRAAARHIQHLHTLFGDWRLVIAAYNCGQGRLDRAIRKSGTRDFWKLKSLPRETRNHVPRFMAALLISKDPEWFGFGDVVYQDPLAYDTVPISEWIDLRLAAECARTPLETMRRLNPELRRGYTPAAPVLEVYPLRVPVGASDRFRINYARIPDHRKVRMVDYRVRSGDTVSGIAQQIGVSTQAVLDANGIRNPRRLRAGRRLKIPIGPESYTRARKVSKSQIDASPDPSRHIRLTYTVRRGDTLWDIAQTFHTSVKDLKKWNGIRHASRIHAGEKLLVQPADAPLID